MKKKFLKCFMSFAVAFSLLGTYYADDNTPQPRVMIEACNGSSRYIQSVSSAKRELYSRTGQYIAPGNSKTISFGSNYSVSNSANIDILPELLSYGFERSVSVSASVSDTINNNTSQDREVGVYRMYKIVTYTSYSYLGNGYCEVRQNQTMKVYTGWMLALI